MELTRLGITSLLVAIAAIACAPAQASSKATPQPANVRTVAVDAFSSDHIVLKTTVLAESLDQAPLTDSDIAGVTQAIIQEVGKATAWDAVKLTSFKHPRVRIQIVRPIEPPANIKVQWETLLSRTMTEDAERSRIQNLNSVITPEYLALVEAQNCGKAATHLAQALQQLNATRPTP